MAMATDFTNDFVRERFDTIAALFSENDPEDLKQIFGKLKKRRSKKLFA